MSAATVEPKTVNGNAGESVPSSRQATPSKSKQESSQQDQQADKQQNKRKNKPKGKPPQYNQGHDRHNQYERGDGGGYNYYPPKSNVIFGAPTLDLPPKERSLETEKKFTGRCRLFVANLPGNVTEESLRTLFGEYGEISEVFLGAKNAYAFIKMDTRAHAEAARQALDLKNYEGRTLRVRLAAHAAAVRVKNLPAMVTNELLEYAFSYFGEVERAIVIADDRGRSVGEGIVEFARKAAAQAAIKKCSENCYLLTSIPRPIVVEAFDQRDEDEGFPEKNANHNSFEFRQEREVGPRFAEPGTFEHEFAMRWKQLYEFGKQKRDRLELEIAEARKILQDQMEYAKIEHETHMLREQLRQMEEQSKKLSHHREQRQLDEQRREEVRRQHEASLKQKEEEILRRAQMKDFSALRQQENELRAQANALQDLITRQEQALQMPVGHPHHPHPGPPGPMNDGMNLNSIMNAPPQNQGPPMAAPSPLQQFGQPMGPNPFMGPGGMNANPMPGAPPPPPMDMSRAYGGNQMMNNNMNNPGYGPGPNPGRGSHNRRGFGNRQGPFDAPYKRPRRF